MKERICWAITILASLIACSVPITEVWQKWRTSPVIVTFAENSSPTASLPFPTVTVCPSVKYRPVNFDYAFVSQKPEDQLTVEEKTKIDAVNMMCDGDTFHGDGYSYFANESNVRYMKELAPSLSESVECEYYLSGFVDCLDYMDTVVTEEGVCFTFNALPSTAVFSADTVQYHEKENGPYQLIWTPEGGYIDRVISLEMKPYRALNVGVWTGLTLVLKLNTSEQDYSCFVVQGFKVILTNPADALAMVYSGYYLPSSGLTQVAISPIVMDTSEDLRSYSSIERHCLYPHENELEFFKIYTQDNCRLECLTKVTFNNCGCVNYFMPRTKNMPICGPRSKQCLDNSTLMFDAMRIERLVFEDELEICTCLPACKTIKYSADISQTNFELENVMKRNSSVDKNISTNIVMVYFKDSEFLASKRSELYGYGGFIAQCGGLLGLCCGFSILSLMELIYYTTVRMWSDNWKRDKGQQTDALGEETLPTNSEKSGTQDLNLF